MIELCAPPPYSFDWHPGLGQTSQNMTPQQEATLIQGAGAAINSAISASTVAGQAGAATTAAFDVGALFAGPAAPIVAAIGNFLGPLIAKFNGCGQTCVEAANIANQIGTPMTQAFQAYMSAPVHYYSAQQTFLNLFNQLMAALNQACGNPALGTAGQNCIADNSPSACHWKAAPGGWTQNSDGSWTYTYWGAAGSGTSCWNPYVGIYDEVLNDPTVVPDPVVSVSSSASSPNPAGSSPSTAVFQSNSPDLATPLIALAVVGVLVWVVMS